MDRSDRNNSPFAICHKRFTQGFTLLELLIYVGILSLVGLVGTSLFLSVSRSYFRNISQTEVTQNLRLASQIIQQAIRSATKVNSASSSTLELAMADSSKNPTRFTLSGDTLYRQEGGGSVVALTSNKVTVPSLNFISVTTQQTTMDPVDHWAWSGDGVGWIDFSPALGNVRVPLGSGDFYGYAYIPSTNGYISLNCETTASCGTVSYKAYSDAASDLHGWAWSDQFGWLSFNSAETTSTIAYKVAVSTTTGDFSGWAWSENVGWLSFNSADTTSTVAYKVKAAPRLGRPINSVRVVITVAYNVATVSPLYYSDTYDFSVALGQPSLVTISNVTPGQATSTVTLLITGSNFQSGAAVKLARIGELDILPTSSCTLTGSTQFSCAFDVTGKAKGKWDVVVINPDAALGIYPEGLDVQ